MRARLSPACKRLVGLGQRLLRADVEPAAGHTPAVDRSPRVQPLDEPPGLVRVVSVLKVLAHEPQRRPRVEVERNARQGAARPLGLLLQPRDAVVAVELDHRIATNGVEVPDVIHAKRRATFRQREDRKRRDALAEEVVSGQDEEVVVELRLADRQVEIADRAKPGLVVDRAVVQNPQRQPGAPGRPLAEGVRELGVGDHVHLVEALDPIELLHQTVEHRLPPDGEQRLGPVEGQRVEPRRVPRGEDDRLHAGTAAPRASAYGARWTPCSVTIAEISSAGVTSKAGFHASKRELTSSGSRSSIGMSAPLPMDRSTDDEGATTWNGTSCLAASTASG